MRWMKVSCWVLFLSLLTQASWARRPYKLSLAPSLGWRQENFSWSIAKNAYGGSPNVLSELTWSALQGPLFSIHAEWNFWRNFSAGLIANRMLIQAGRVTDVDFQKDNRQLPSNYNNFRSNQGGSTALVGALSYKFFLNENFCLQASIGYSIDRQWLFLLGDRLQKQEIPLHSTYCTRWQGGLLGLRTSLLWKRYSIALGGSYTQIRYVANANWNLAPTFAHPISFQHHAKGYVLSGQAQGAYIVYKNLKVFLSSSFLTAVTGYGVDQVFLASGRTAFTRLNPLHRLCTDITIGMMVLCF